MAKHRFNYPEKLDRCHFCDNTEGEDWTQILNIPQDEQGGLTMQALQRYFRRAALRTHPDQGGSAKAFQAVQRAYEVGQRVLAIA